MVDKRVYWIFRICRLFYSKFRLRKTSFHTGNNIDYLKTVQQDKTVHWNEKILLSSQNNKQFGEKFFSPCHGLHIAWLTIQLMGPVKTKAQSVVLVQRRWQCRVAFVWWPRGIHSRGRLARIFLSKLLVSTPHELLWSAPNNPFCHSI